MWVKHTSERVTLEEVGLPLVSPYLLPPLQLTEDSLKALVHVVELNSQSREENMGLVISDENTGF